MPCSHVNIAVRSGDSYRTEKADNEKAETPAQWTARLERETRNLFTWMGGTWSVDARGPIDHTSLVLTQVCPNYILYAIRPHVTREVVQNTRPSFRFSGRVWARDYLQHGWSHGQNQVITQQNEWHNHAMYFKAHSSQQTYMFPMCYTWENSLGLSGTLEGFMQTSEGVLTLWISLPLAGVPSKGEFHIIFEFCINPSLLFRSLCSPHGKDLCKKT